MEMCWSRIWWPHVDKQPGPQSVDTLLHGYSMTGSSQATSHNSIVELEILGADAFSKFVHGCVSV